MTCSFCQKLSDYMWANQKEMMRYDHTKPAPCISHEALLYLRSAMSVGMLIATVFILIATGGQSLIYLSQWSLILTTLTFALLALAQIKSQKKRKEGISLDERASASDNQISVLDKPYQSYKWTVFTYQLAFSLNWVVFLFFYFILFFQILNPDIQVAWWDH